MCLLPLFSLSAPIIRWPEADFKTLTAVWLRAYKNAWNIGRSTAACLLTFPRENGGLQVKLPLVTPFDSMWSNLERCHQFDDGTRQMMKLAYQETLTDNACSNLLELQKEAGLLSWNKAGENEFTFACYLANKLEIQGKQVSVKCLSIETAGSIATTDQGRLHSLKIDRQSRSPGLPSLREATTTTYGAAVWLSQLPGFPSARPTEDEIDHRPVEGTDSGDD